MLKRSACWSALSLLLVVVTSVALTGCVERQIIITTDPAAAVVFDEFGEGRSATPVDRTFTYYGKYRFKIVKDGFETLTVEEDIRAPWYEWLGLDFISENVVPWTIRDIRRFHYQLTPLQVVPPETVLQQGAILRERGKTIGTPLPGIPVPVPPPQ